MSSSVPLRVAIYARYSDEKQNPRSIEDQLRDCTAFAKRHGWEIAGVYTDAAITGAIKSRPGYRKLIADLATDAYDILLAEQLDRITRDDEEMSGLQKRLKFYGKELWTVSEGRVNKIFAAVKSTMDSLFLDDLALKTKRGQRGAIERGGHAGGKAFGYRSVREFSASGEIAGAHLEIMDEQAEVVRHIFREYAAGRSAKAIAADLNRDGIAAPSSDHWRQSTINGNRARGTGILNNELYVGQQIWNRQRFSRHPETEKRVARLNPPEDWLRQLVPHLRIVPEELWDAVKARQKSLDEKLVAQQRTSGGKNGRAGIGATRRSLTVLAGVLYCGCCGGRMTPSGGKYLRCSTAAETGGSVCAHTRNYKRASVEARMLRGLDRELMRPEAIEGFIKLYNGRIAETNARKAAEHVPVEKELRQVERQLEQAVNAVLDGLCSPALRAKIEELEARRADFLSQSAKPVPAAISLHPGAANLYRAKIRDLTAALKDGEAGNPAREALRALIERATLTPDESAEDGFEVDIEGRLAELLQAAGIEKRDAEEVDSVSRCSGQLVAGAGFEPATFRL